MSLQDWLRRGCEHLAGDLPSRIIQRRDSPYLGRYYLRRNEGPRKSDLEEVAASLDLAHGEAPPKTSAWLPNIYLHHFLSGDGDEELHNHPFDLMVSFVLVQGYLEERRTATGSIRKRKVSPFTFNLIRADDFHRVDLIDGQTCWTLFFAWNKKQSWGFWDRVTDQFTPWMDH